MDQPVQPGTLYVEVRKLAGVDDGFGSTSIEELVRKHISRCYKELRVGQQIPLSPSLETLVDLIEVKGHSNARATAEVTVHPVPENKITDLPHEALEGIWESLTYEEPIGEDILHVLTAAVQKWHARPNDLAQTAYFNTVLLSGPPGSGKTSLAHALGQRLSIRLSGLYSCAKMLQVDGSAMFSPMYGGTAKQINAMFSAIDGLGAGNPEEPQLIVVVIDEVDKLVPCRKNLGQKNEPLDSMRATAEVLLGLDRLRTSINIIWFFTTNLLEELDAAFVDRCLQREVVKAPGASCMYELLRGDLNTHIRRQDMSILSVLPSEASPSDMDTPGQVTNTSSAGCTTCAGEIPRLHWANTNTSPAVRVAAAMLQDIAACSVGLSARHVRGLLDVAVLKCSMHGAAILHEVLAVLATLVRKETGVTLSEECCNHGKSWAGRGRDGRMDGDMELPMAEEEEEEEEEEEIFHTLPIDANVYSSDV